MVKTKLFDENGKAGKEISLPKNFSQEIRADILLKVFETQKGIYSQAYGSMEGAGAQYSASGISRKRRHIWKGTYGKGISRIPRKIMSRHGSSFNWVGATVSSTRGGRRPHAPRSAKNPFKKTNKKELLIAFDSAFMGTMDQKAIEKKYGKKIESGFVFDEKILAVKTKEFLQVLRNLFGEEANFLKKKTVRSGIGKMRGRKYKSNAGLLFIIGSKEKMRRKGIDVVPVNELKIMDLSPNGEPGRLACYTENAINEIGERFK
ncbi:MAG: 50S ribosomal protein L4 [archaeon]|nr:50S ribosomal protein L4 [archaeon]MCR4323810.1 50S ribosomal protein L4 [Nanoarchaeota archaeon]